jgi:hypothetical protein
MRLLVHQSKFSNKVKIKDANYHNTKCPDIILPKITVGGMATWCSLKLVCSQTYHMTWTQQHCRLHSQFIMILHQHKDQPLIHSTISPQVLQNYTLETCWMGAFNTSSVLKNTVNLSTKHEPIKHVWYSQETSWPIWLLIVYKCDNANTIYWPKSVLCSECK